MKETRREYALSGNISAAETDWQRYYVSVEDRFALSDIDDNEVLAEQIIAINREPVDTLIPNCPPNPPDGFPDATSQRFYYLSEIVGDDIPPGSPECGAALACFLSQIVAAQINPNNNPAQVHSHATLVVDRDCVVRQALTLPNRFTLAGIGPDGGGFLSFEDLPDGASALRFAPAVGSAVRMTTIRDIRISGGASCCGQAGINVSHSQFVYIDRVRMSGFAFGVSGETAYSIFISNSSIHGNGFALTMGEDTTTWRVRDSVMNQNLIGAVITATARGHVISGARIEANSVTGVYVNGSMNVIESSWFEGNGTLPQGSSPEPTHHGIRITNLAQKTRVLSNVFSSQLIGDEGTETQSCFNMSFAPESGNVNQKKSR
jgi:hypothetical protein